MTLNETLASRELTETGRVFNRSGERQAIRRALPVFFRNGGMVATYGLGSSWDRPASVMTKIGRKTVRVDVAAYVETIKGRLDAKATAKRRQHDERLARAADMVARNA